MRGYVVTWLEDSSMRRGYVIWLKQSKPRSVG